MFSTIAYCFAIRMRTLRQIEEMCNYDLRTMYLMDNERPSYKTFSNSLMKLFYQISMLSLLKYVRQS